MRIAVLIYGRLNKCAEHYNNILNSIGDHDIDLANVLYSDESVKLMGPATKPTMDPYINNVVQFLSKSIDEGVLPATLTDAIEISKQLKEMAQMSNENRK